VFAGLLAGIGATIVNLLVAAVASAIFPVPTAFRPFMPLPILAACLGGSLGVAGLYGLLERTSRNPKRAFTTIALVALLVSFILPVWLLEPSIPGKPGVGLEILSALILMHIIVVWLSVRAIQRLSRSEKSNSQQN
jgi:hypothetical protein